MQAAHWEALSRTEEDVSARSSIFLPILQLVVNEGLPLCYVQILKRFRVWDVEDLRGQLSALVLEEGP